MKLNRNIRKFSFLIFVLVVVQFCLFSLFPFILTVNAVSDQAMINSLIWDSTPIWSNSTTITKSIGSLTMLPYNVTSNAQNDFNLTLYNNTNVCAYKYTFRLYKVYGGYPTQPDTLYLEGTSLKYIGIYLLSGASGTYTISSYIGGSASGSFTLNYGSTYDIQQIVVFNNTYTTYSWYTSNLTVYTGGHLGENSYKINSASYSYGNVGFSFTNDGHIMYGGASGDTHLISNQYVYKVTTGTTPPSSSGTNIDITQIPIQLGLRLGISIFASGIIVVIILLLFVELPLMIFASDNIILMTIFGILILCVGVALTWLPLWTLIIVVVLVALLFADVFRKFLTGTH